MTVHPLRRVGALLLGLVASANAACTWHQTACTASPLTGFVHRAGGVLHDPDNGGERLKFASINVPNLHRIEFDDGTVRAPTTVEIADALCSVKQMGGGATRMYVLSHGDGEPYHINSGAQLNEAWFVVLDEVIAMAAEVGVRLILPFVNTHWLQHWGSSSQYAAWLGAPGDAGEFFYSAEQRALFKTMVRNVLERRNTLTGRLYKDEPAILAFELGNELHDVRYADGLAPPPTEWSNDVAAFIKGIDAHHLVMDGAQFSAEASLALSADVDLVGRTYYNLPVSALVHDLELVEAWNGLARASAGSYYNYNYETSTARPPTAVATPRARTPLMAVASSAWVAAWRWAAATPRRRRRRRRRPAPPRSSSSRSTGSSRRERRRATARRCSRRRTTRGSAA